MKKVCFMVGARTHCLLWLLDILISFLGCSKKERIIGILLLQYGDILYEKEEKKDEYRCRCKGGAHTKYLAKQAVGGFPESLSRHEHLRL